MELAEWGLVLGIGGNLPESRSAFSQFKILVSEAGHTIFSSIYSTKPFQDSAGQNYLNFCCALNWKESTESALVWVHELESQLGRVRTSKKWDERIIDIDILLHNNSTISTPSLIVPHYELAIRDFFLKPLSELFPTKKIKQYNQTANEMLAAIPEKLLTYPQITESVWD